MGIAAVTLIYTTAERLQIQIIRILYGCGVGGYDGNPGLRFAYPGL